MIIGMDASSGVTVARGLTCTASCLPIDPCWVWSELPAVDNVNGTTPCLVHGCRFFASYSDWWGRQFPRVCLRWVCWTRDVEILYRVGLCDISFMWPVVHWWGNNLYGGCCLRTGGTVARCGDAQDVVAGLTSVASRQHYRHKTSMMPAPFALQKWRETPLLPPPSAPLRVSRFKSIAGLWFRHSAFRSSHVGLCWPTGWHVVVIWSASRFPSDHCSYIGGWCLPVDKAVCVTLIIVLTVGCRRHWLKSGLALVRMVMSEADWSLCCVTFGMRPASRYVLCPIRALCGISLSAVTCCRAGLAPRPTGQALSSWPVMIIRLCVCQLSMCLSPSAPWIPFAGVWWHTSRWDVHCRWDNTGACWGDRSSAEHHHANCGQCWPRVGSLPHLSVAFRTCRCGLHGRCSHRVVTHCRQWRWGVVDSLWVFIVPVDSCELNSVLPVLLSASCRFCMCTLPVVLCCVHVLLVRFIRVVTSISYVLR